MDTKTPPIPLKLPEKAQTKKQERLVDLSLPPLTPSTNRRQKLKPVVNTCSRDFVYPTCYQNHHKKRPYRVLQIGATPLMHACQQADRHKVLRLLREQEESIGYRDRTLRSALHYCMDAGTGGAVASAAPELVNAPDAEGHTPLHLAVIAGDTQLVAVLLANGADVNAKDLEGHSVLHWATVCGEAECVRLILAAGARPSTPDLRGGSPLHYAAQCCGAAATAELAVPKKVGLKVLQTLIEFGADVNAKDEDGRQAILWAASAGSVEAILALARAGGAAAAGASDKDGLTALHCAASRGHARCVEALINLCGSQPDHVDDNGCSALHYAATLGHADATSLILKLGADPNRQDRKGRTPALCAAAKGQLETLKILAQHGGSLHARTVRGTGVAHEAAASGRIELLRWLAKKRPSMLDIATQDGKTPLHVAALHGHLDGCKVLLDHGARINAILRTNKGNTMTALDAALYRGHRDCAKLIQMHGGTTAQRLRDHRATSTGKVYTAKLRIERTESGTDTEGSPPRWDYHRLKAPRVYYEERWIEKRTRKRGNSKKLLRRDSRSFSEEELRFSKKASPRKERQRRSRSESARYDENRMDTDEKKLTRKGRKRRVTGRSKDNYSESSINYSDDSLQEDLGKNGTVRTYFRRKLERRRSKSRADKIKKRSRSEIETNRANLRHLQSAIKSDQDEHSGTDDSLEVIVVRTSVEKKKCEKIVSGGKAKMSKENSKDGRIRESHKRNLKSQKSESSEFTVPSDKVYDEASDKAPEEDARVDHRPYSDKKEKDDVGYKDVAGVDELASKSSTPEDMGMSFVESRYNHGGDVTDSTSHETVERVLVTAMVHKDQGPDTPKSTIEISKEVTFDDGPDKEMIDKSCELLESKIDDVYAKSEQLSNSLVTKAKDIKKGLENMRSGIKDKNENDSERSDDDKRMVGDVETVEGRLRAHHVNEPERTPSDSQEAQDQRGKIEHQEDSFINTKGDRKILDISPSATKDVASCVDAVNDGLTSEIDSQDLHTLEGSFREEMPSLTSEELSKVEREKRGSEEVTETMEKHDINGTLEKGVPLDILKNTASVETCKGNIITDGFTLANKESFKIGEEKRQSEELSSTSFDAPFSNGFFSEDKEQIDSARGKSVELSSDSRDSALMRENENDFSRTNTPVLARSNILEVKSDGHKASSDPNKVKIVQIDASTKSSTNEEKVFSSKEEKNGSPTGTTKRSRCSRASARKQMEGAECHSSLAKGSSKIKNLFDKSGERSLDRSAIVAVIESPEWDEEDEEIDKEIRKVIGEDGERDTEPEENNEMGVIRVLPGKSEEEAYRSLDVGKSRNSGIVTLPQVQRRPCTHSGKILKITAEDQRLRQCTKQCRRDSGGRDSGIEPSPRISRIPKRRNVVDYSKMEKHHAINVDTITRDVQISLRRYHLERKIFFQLMELKRLQIRHGRANEQVLVKRQVESFHKAGMTGPTLGVAKYDQPLTFRHFEAFLYEQLRKLQRRPATPNFCTDAKYCTQRTHRCHHATTAYTSVPVYTYIGGEAQERPDHFPKIETRGKGQMTVEVTHGDEKQVIALPAERLDCTKRYFVTFTVRGESQGTTKSSHSMKRSATSV
ncbi:ankycorbin-like isoform X2 [Vespa velutina]|uniref:ankycorbin-like isoform X2 n=1 Tax=Vespa velutina TaxID=202808 RepID=UPI001FB2E110|nr:ankycorbin-like isoform X2 [Vespa velutina]